MKWRVSLHEGHDGEPGIEAWVPALIGFATWAPTEADLYDRLTKKLDEHFRWLAHHRLNAPSEDPGFEVVERVTGGEVLFETDDRPASPEEIDLALHLLAASRADLLAALDGASDDLLDWDPPYARFAAWADWRTIRANLVHVANGETHYYLPSIGHQPDTAPATPEEDWRRMVHRSREEAAGFLRELRSSSDRTRLTTIDHGFGEERWSVRKVLRRMVRHELTHWKSIRRIGREYERRIGS